MAATPVGPGGMRFHVDAWDPSYGASVDGSSAAVESTARVTHDVELAGASWRPIAPTPVSEPSAILFVDGVRRVDARLWVEQSGTHDATMALCASYAAGVVCCCPSAGAHLLGLERRRGLFTTATNASDVTTSAGTYSLHATPDNPDASLVVLLSTALQRELAQLELMVAAAARRALHNHTAPGTDAADGDLLVVDGPLHGRTHLPRAIGFVKTHQATYLPPELHSMVGTLGPGERTPVFLMGTSWDRHSWYLRLPCDSAAPWAGVVRIECPADVPSATAVRMANLSQTVLPRFASSEYKDPRAPQNLVPIAGLERVARHRLGDVTLINRALRRAASGLAGGA
jgi:hypothetical protein